MSNTHRLSLQFELLVLLISFLIVRIGLTTKAETLKSEKGFVKKEGLYNSATDDVIILNENNMNDRVHGNDMVWMIQFYNSWCGHCIHFAPTWKSVATDLKGWRQVVSVGAIDCSTGGNLRVCRQFKIVAYPTILLIPPNFSLYTPDDKIKTLKNREKREMKKAVLDYITNPQFPVPATWPSLHPVKSIKEIQQDINQRHKLVVVIFEKERSTVGVEVILDLVDYPDILVRRMLEADVRKQGVVSFPSVHQVLRDSPTSRHLISGSGDPSSDRRRFVDHLLSLTGHLDSEGHRMKGEGQMKGQTDEEDEAGLAEHMWDQKNGGKQQGEKDRVYMQDVESTLTYALRHEVAVHSSIQGARLHALRQFVSVLAKYLPGRPPVSRFLHKVAHYLGQVDALTGETWLAAVTRLQDQEAFLPDQVRWVGCRGSRPRYRGYPCGLWTLFHVLTVAAYEDGEGDGGREALLAIRSYMEHFFGCEECAQHFLKMAANLEAKIRTPTDAVLWLWMAHNKVNKRLHGDVSEDPHHPKIQFPSAQSCPQCRPQQESDSDRVPWWKSSAVVGFLARMYGEKNLILNFSFGEGNNVAKDGKEEEMDWLQAKQQEALLKLPRDRIFQQGRSAVWKNGREMVPDPHHFPVMGGIDMQYAGRAWGVRHVDVGMYVVFYVLCGAILVALYYYFIVHKRSKTPCSKCPTV